MHLYIFIKLGKNMWKRMCTVCNP